MLLLQLLLSLLLLQGCLFFCGLLHGVSALLGFLLLLLLRFHCLLGLILQPLQLSLLLLNPLLPRHLLLLLPLKPLLLRFSVPPLPIFLRFLLSLLPRRPCLLLFLPLLFYPLLQLSLLILKPLLLLPGLLCLSPSRSCLLR